MPHIRSQKYAQRAFGLIQKVKDDNKQVKEYRTLALNFPTMILQSGLAQAIGFLQAKGKDKDKEAKGKEEYLLLLAHIAELLEENKDSLHKKILEADLSHYQLLTRQAIEAASSLKRYTQALLPKPKDEQGGQS
ncbi:type III-B CRISPR module-associated protein Cmr5 [Neisseria sp. HMSC064F04]|jgi:CRISPR-associated protein, cmr5 family|uniref:type III-B CRISPR module-associated protein Cmr5 n=1 Tax=Neisseria mucosa TaxID=488 RepID=UPI0008A5CA21|nr:type III-B CRISPR module-associated protein Cmr5 [Neisseria mucosa]OFN34739.1 type III-B CRISPR module-associated protein Cmr5 [Neisseria sp. HMSC059F02]OHR43632.1 type III-B CRISPR module-associated protein Cmr5 [Neisseria sp. HMSC064F04]